MSGLSTFLVLSTSLFGAGCLSVASMCYKVCRPSQILVKTGLGIKRMEISNSGFVWPFQQHIFLSKEPITYDFNLQSMTTEKIEFRLPMVISVAPILPTDDLEATIRFARYFSDSTDAETLKKTILGIVEGEARNLTAEMTVDELFQQRDMFKQLMTDRVGTELYELGLKIINANIKELTDCDKDNKYFTYRKQRAIETANYQAKVDVAEAKKAGDIGLKERASQTRIAIAKLDTEATKAENSRGEDVSNSEATLEEIKAHSRQRSEVANIEATMGVRNIESDLQKKVEIARQLQKLEELRAEQLAKTKVSAEKQIQESFGDSEYIKIMADANLYQSNASSKGVLINLQSQGEGLKHISRASNGDTSIVKFYLALNDNLYEKLAKQQAKAIKNLEPVISIWNTGNSSPKSLPNNELQVKEQ